MLCIRSVGGSAGYSWYVKHKAASFPSQTRFKNSNSTSTKKIKIDRQAEIAEAGEKSANMCPATINKPTQATTVPTTKPTFQ